MENTSNEAGVVGDAIPSTQSKMISIRNELEIIRRAVTCSICLCTMKEPITLAGCAHSFCYTCIRQSMEGGGKQSKCPLCQLPMSRRSIQKPSNVGANSVRTLIDSYKQMMRSFGCAPIQYTPSIHTLTQLEPMDEENDSDDEDDDAKMESDRPIPSTSQDIFDQWQVSLAMLQALKDQQQGELNVGTTVVTEQILHEQAQIVQVNEQCYRSRCCERDSPAASPKVTSFRPQRQSWGSTHRTPLSQKKKPPATMDSIPLLEKSPHTLTQILQQAQSQEAANQRTPSPTPEEENFYSAIDLPPPPSVSPMKKPQRTSLVPVDEESPSSSEASQGVLSATSPRRKSVSEILQQEEDDDDHSTASSASELPPPAFQMNRSKSTSPVAGTVTAPQVTSPENPPPAAKLSKSNQEDVPTDSSVHITGTPKEAIDTMQQDDREDDLVDPIAVAPNDSLCDDNAKDEAIELPNEKVDDPAALQVGDIVQVQARTWPGINQLGGIAKILKMHATTEGTLYDVRYVLDRRKERNIQEIYVSLHTEIQQATKGDAPKGSRRRSSDASTKENVVAADAIPPSLRKKLIADGCDIDGSAETIQALDHFKKSKAVAKRTRDPEDGPLTSRKRCNPGPTNTPQTTEQVCLAAEESYRQRIQTALNKGILYICTSTLSERDQRVLQQLCHILQKSAPGRGKRSVDFSVRFDIHSTDLHFLAI